MFNKLKQFKNLRQQAKKMQSQMEQEMLEVSKDGVRLKINGANEVLELDCDDELLRDKERLTKAFKKVFNDAVKDMQKRMAKKMMSGGGNFDFDALKNLGL